MQPDSHLLSKLVLRLYDAARSDPAVAFQDQAMATLGEVIAFDGGWWGHAVRTAAGHRVHGSHLFNLPQDVPMLLNSTDPDNVMARTSSQHPGRAMTFSSDMPYGASASTVALNLHMRAHQSMCVTQVDRTSGLLCFVAITRDRGMPAFREVECQWLELLMPHLAAALDVFFRVQMTRWHARHVGKQLLATSDAEGFMHIFEPGLPDLLREEWPTWSGHRLPEELVDHLANGQREYAGKRVHAEFHWSGQRVLIPFRQRSPLDGLTTQERAVSRAFASGLSYKEVARSVGVAPATVRHHLRSVYLKLGVTEKCALAHLVGAEAR